MSNINFRDIERLPIDFEEIMVMLKNRIQTRLPNRWTDFLASNFGVELLEAVSYEAALMYYYLNSSVNECFMPTSKTKTGVYSLAKTIGYKPKTPEQSIVTLKFYLDSPYSKNIDIPMYTKIESDNNIPFYTTENKTLYAGELFVEISAKSGTLVSESIISTGEIRKRYKLRDYPVNSIESVYVNDELYTKVDYIDQTGLNKYYMLDHDENLNGYISFGDGNYGINPAKNLLIDVLYVVGADSTHNIEPYRINKILDMIYDSSSDLFDNLKVVNEFNAVGASDGETLDEVKRNAPSLYRTQHRCVTTQDFRDIVLAKSNTEKVSIIDNEVMNEVGIFGVKVCVIPEGGGYPTQAFKDSLISTLEDKRILATQIEVIDPVFIPFDVNVSIQVQKDISSSIVTNKIREAITDYLKWENNEFGEVVSTREIYRLVSDIPGILNINNINVDEQRTIYVSELPVVGTNYLYVNDTINTLNIGTEISIMKSDGSGIALHTTITNIDSDVYSLEDTITEDMNIGLNSIIYPVLEVDGDHKFGNKEILLKNNSILGEERRDYALLNMSYLKIYFDDNHSKYYNILFRNGDLIYLNQPIDRKITDGTKIYVVSKKNIPTLASVTTTGSSILHFVDYPRFTKGAELIRQEMISFIPETLTAVRSTAGVDYLNTYMDIDYLVSISKIYKNVNEVFEVGTDYNLLNNGTTIQWTTIGKSKLPSNSIYYITIIKKKVNKSPTELSHYVKNINGKYVEVSPTIPVKLLENTVFDYISDVYSLTPYEISDIGTININII